MSFLILYLAGKSHIHSYYTQKLDHLLELKSIQGKKIVNSCIFSSVNNKIKQKMRYRLIMVNYIHYALKRWLIRKYVVSIKSNGTLLCLFNHKYM